MSTTRRALATAILLTAACGAPDAAAPTFEVRDSAGVRILTHAPARAAELSLSDSPIARLGAQAGDSLALFEVNGAVFLSPQEFVVADAGNYRVLRFTTDGELLQTIGGQGDGPGEFQSIVFVQAAGGGFATYDSRARRVTWFDPQGEVVRTRPFQPERPELSDDAIFTNGQVLSVIDESRLVGYATAFAEPKGVSGPLPVVADVGVFDSLSAQTSEAGRFTVIDWYEDPTAEGFPVANLLESGRIYWSGRDDRLAITDVTAHRVDVLEAGARVLAIIENRPRVPFTPDSIPSGYAGAVDSLPAYDDVRIDAEERLWIRPSVAEGVETTGWRVFSPAGERIGTLDLPSDASVLDATRGLILLLRRDELDVESIEVWELLP